MPKHYPFIATHSTSIAFDNPVTSYPQKTVAGPLTFTPNSVGATAGYGAIYRLVADGTNVPNLSAFKAVGAGTYDNTAGKVNQLVFFYDGVDYCVGINQLGTVSVGGGGDTGGTTDTTAPTVVSATAINSTTIRIVFSEVIATGSGSLGLGWAFKKNGSALAISAVSGSGTNTLDFTVAAMSNGDTILRSYDSATGDCKDAAGNEVVSFTDAAVTNSIAGGASYDTDAEAYFTKVEAVGGTLSTTEKTKYSNWVVAEKSAARYTKYTAIYPMLGGTAAAHRINAKDPNTIATNIDFSGTWTHSSLGSKPGGTSSDFANTNIQLSALGQNSAHIAIYVNEDLAGGYDMGVETAGAKMAIVGKWTDSSSYAYGYGANLSAPVANADAKGLYIVSRIAANEYRFSVKGTIQTITEASTAAGSGTIRLGTVGNFTPTAKRVAFATIGQGFDATELAGMHTNTVTLQTDLGRN